MINWISTAERLPPNETTVLIIMHGALRVGAIFTELSNWESGRVPCDYWDDPEDDGQCWSFCDVTHWAEINLPESES